MNEVLTASLPFVMPLNEWITGTILWCFISMTYVFSVSKYALLQSLREFFSTRERNSIFNEQTMNEIYSRLLLIMQTCLLASILFMNSTIHQQPHAFSHSDTPLLLTYHFIAILLFYLVKWGIYKLVNWIFFDNIKSKLWSESYIFVLSMLGIFFFPVTLLAIYAHFPPSIITSVILVIFILSNLLLFYKCFSIFFNRLHGVFFLFVYFCTLEILPFFVLSRGLEIINELFI